MTRSRGLTLVETLAATVLLVALAVACAGLLRSARSAFVHAEEASVDPAELAALAEVFAENPKEHGLTAWPPEPGIAVGAPWPNDELGRDVMIARIDPVVASEPPPAGETTKERDEDPLRYGCVLIECEGTHAICWVRLRESPPEAAREDRR